MCTAVVLLLMAALTLLLGLAGCATYSTLMMNAAGEVRRCAASGHGYIGVPQAGSIHQHCVDDLRQLGYAPLPPVFLGIGSDAAGVITSVSAGLRVGDTITTWDGQTGLSYPAQMALLQQKAPGETIQITYLRDGQTATTPVIVGRRGE